MEIDIEIFDKQKVDLLNKKLEETLNLMKKFNIKKNYVTCSGFNFKISLKK